MRFEEALDGFDAYLRANRGLSENTRKAYRSDVNECLSALEKHGCEDLNEVSIEDARMAVRFLQRPCAQQYGA